MFVFVTPIFCTHDDKDNPCRRLFILSIKNVAANKETHKAKTTIIFILTVPNIYRIITVSVADRQKSFFEPRNNALEPGDAETGTVYEMEPLFVPDTCLQIGFHELSWK